MNRGKFLYSLVKMFVVNVWLGQSQREHSLAVKMDVGVCRHLVAGTVFCCTPYQMWRRWYNNIAKYSGKTQSRPRLTDSVVSSKALYGSQTRFVNFYSKNIKWTGPEVF